MAGSSPAVRKEIRALLPVWAAAMAGLVLGRFGMSHWSEFIGLLAFGFGSILVGAQSFGHEFSHNTLTLLLSQPISRRRMFLRKALVLVAAIGTLTVTALVLFPDALTHLPSVHAKTGLLVIALACSLCVAPWLTIICRSAVAGTVFSIAIPGLLGTAADFAGSIIYGLENSAAIDRFARQVFWTGMTTICVGSAIAAWYAFNRLEAIEGGHAEFQLPGSTPSDAAAGALLLRRQSAWRAIFAKELRLQQLAFIMATAFAVLWLGTAWREHLHPGDVEFPFLPATFLYAGILAPVIGAMTSAQERQLGTLEWQVMLPISTWRQWLVKVGVAWLLAATFGVALPAALAYVTAGDSEPIARHQVFWLTFIVLGLASAGIYMSSVCRTAVTALVLTFPAVFLLVLLFRAMVDQATLTRSHVIGSARVAALGLMATDVLVFALVAGLSGLLVALAFANHRRLDVGPRVLLGQAVAIGGCVTIAIAVLLAAG